MNKFTMAVIAVAIGLGAAAASAATPVSQNPGYYAELYVGSGVGGSGSVSANATSGESLSTGLNPKPGYFVSAAAGRSFAYGLALEGEFLYSRNDVSAPLIENVLGAPARADVSAYGGLVNAMWAVTRIGPFIPYVGAGVGYGGVRYGFYSTTVNDSGVMWQLKTGLSYPIASHVSLDLGYRYLTTPAYNLSGSINLWDTSYSGSVGAHTHLHIVTAGARVRF